MTIFYTALLKISFLKSCIRIGKGFTVYENLFDLFLEVPYKNGKYFKIFIEFN